MTLSVFDALKTVAKNSFDRKKFWIHSISVGNLSLMLAKECEFLLVDDIFTAGLLHDLGKVFLDGFMHEEFESIITKAEEEKTSFFEAEHLLYDVDHTMVGEWMARTWQLPLHVIAGIKHHHHEVEKRSGLSVSQDPYIDIIRLADTGVKVRNIGHSGDSSSYKPVLDKKLFKRLPISGEDMNGYLDKLENELQKSEDLLNLAL
jgi:putative nucleotidyltransferase with HDIG domain